MPAWPSLGRIPGRDVDLDTDREGGGSARRQIPRPMRRDCPLPVTDKAVYAVCTHRAVASLIGEAERKEIEEKFASYVAATRARERLLVISVS